MTTLTDQHIAKTMHAYVDAVSGDDVEVVVALYAADAVVEDPVGSEPHRGVDAIRAFYATAIQSVARMELEGNVRTREKWGACAMRAYPKGAEDSVVVETLDVMTFDGEGKITSMVAYWGDGNIREISR